jgi:hypothetical protein
MIATYVMYFDNRLIFINVTLWHFHTITKIYQLYSTPNSLYVHKPSNPKYTLGEGY